MTNPTYDLRLHKTCYEKGFFNRGVSVSEFVRRDSGPAALYLGPSKRKMRVSINRSANLNGTLRVMGGALVRDWIQRNCRENDIVEIVIRSPAELWLRKST